MTEILQSENTQEQDVSLEELLNSRKKQEQVLQDKQNNIRFKPLIAKAEKHQAKIDKQTLKAANLTDKINKGNQKIAKWTAKIADAKKNKSIL